MDNQTEAFFSFIFSVVMLAAALLFVWWLIDNFVDATKNLALSIAETEQIKATCFDNGYTRMKWANGEYYCINDATGDITPIESLRENE